MKVCQIIFMGCSVIGISSMKAQDKTSLTLEQAIQMAWGKSNEVELADTKVATSRLELQSARNNQYPDFKIAGQYQKLTKAKANFIQNNSTNNDPNAIPAAAPAPDYLILGQANASLPIFAGFKIQNRIRASHHLYEAQKAHAQQTKEEVALKVVDFYASLYKAQKTVELLMENHKSAKQRVVDFVELEKNGMIPRNDLLKSQLQVSKVQLALDRAQSELNIVNYELATLLKLSPNSKLEIKESDFANFQMNDIPKDEQPALKNRKDLEAIQLEGKASLANLKIAKSGYYPTLAILGGYTALNLQNVLVVQNAINIGLGVSYDLSGVLKNGTSVKIAQSRALEIQNSEAILTDYIKIQVQKAIEDYDLALKQNLVYNQAVEQATENYRIIKDKYDNGLSDTNDLLEADVEQLGSNINKTLARANVIQKYYELLAVSGQLNQTFNLSKI